VRLFSEKYVVREILYDFRYNHKAAPHTAAVILWYFHINHLGGDYRRGYEAGESH
jgi:hypothetical protein